MVATTTMLGYEPGTTTRIFRSNCEGTCLYAASAPTQCLTRTQNMQVALRPSSQTTTVATQVVACGCQGARCSTTVAGTTTFFNDGDRVVDECDRQCTCSFGQLINCCRVRKEFRLSLTLAERLRYVNTIRLVSTTQPYRTTYETLMRKHRINFNNGLHGTALFYPWHREFIWDLENILRQVDCRITVPYWRWSLEATRPFSSTIWAANGGFGGTGGRNGCVSNGPFASPWTTQEVPPRCLTRAFNTRATFATEADITRVIDSNCPSASQFTCFANGIESYHNYVHGSIGGHMVGTLSTNDPMFFMHHSYIDRLWARWQSKSTAHVNAYGGSVNQVHPGGTSRVSEWLDLNRQGGKPENRVCYDDPSNVWWVQSVLSPATSANGGRSLQSVSEGDKQKFRTLGNYDPVSGCTTAERLEKLPRIPLQPFPEEFLMATNMSTDMIMELRRLHDERNNNYTIVSVDEMLATRGPYSELGFYLYDEDFRCFNHPETALGVSMSFENRPTPPSQSVDEPAVDNPFVDSPFVENPTP